MSKRLTIEFVSKAFGREGYILLTTEYKNSNQKLRYICPKQHEHNIRWFNWYQGKRCPYCAGNNKLTMEFIKKEFEKENYILLTNKYKNSHYKLKYICPVGHKHQISWRHWQQGRRCYYCFESLKPPIEFIKSEFNKEGYKLLTIEYKNAHQKLNYVCDSGHTYFITWNNWHAGKRCLVCKHINFSGQGHPNWKGGISCESYCDAWADKEYKKSIKERDGYKCLNPDCWGNIQRLSIHHIDYNKKNCEPQNLITLCTSCNSRANKDRKWHEAWYKAILNNRHQCFIGE